MKIQVPDGMLKAAWAIVGSNDDEALCSLVLEAALRWLSDELQKMTQDDPYENLLRSESMGEYDRRVGFNLAIKKVIHTFLVPEPEIPEEVKDLLVEPDISKWRGDELNAAVIEAFRRGQKSGLR